MTITPDGSPLSTPWVGVSQPGSWHFAPGHSWLKEAVMFFVRCLVGPLVSTLDASCALPTQLWQPTYVQTDIPMGQNQNRLPTYLPPHQLRTISLNQKYHIFYATCWVKLTETKNRKVVAKRWGWGKWEGVSKMVQTVSCRIRTEDLMYNLVTKTDSTVS